ncbi:MAG TPA: hypothetical protein DCX25_03110 [Candidatus Pacebacteria bacterium]|nr:MAG: hypothetical protein UX00_C0007G0166 [Microgenomates group bacterium GW2011_GWB1_45_17]KKU23662.1 MAG: hypothetical protein UX35_C0004G0018 [Microgenomates group bacterium GW2011_GWA1_46_15]KKU24563.1 MAG: hypothetical protein UX36_C0001G0180 [Microgenomates group bacterium GW2011_GWC1_46_15]OGJ21766.1 MAG: hypothetical protein A2804_03165 [Candidatus Pacebacteria bacterium RIFCSPHIGHO2_01_FULL_46_10]HAV15293.1 hypothetical protein [Candidatus Paceibacterota bacterium]
MADTKTKIKTVKKPTVKKAEVKIDKKVEKKVEAKVEVKNGQKTVQTMQEEIVKKRMELLAGKLKDVRSISKLRDELARFKTAERMKELQSL